jgi:hypothetical protein
LSVLASPGHLSAFPFVDFLSYRRDGRLRDKSKPYSLSKLESITPEGKSADASIAPVPTEHTVDRVDIVKGYEYESGKYAIIEPAELKNLRLAGKKTIEISQFAKATEIDPVL